MKELLLGAVLLGHMQITSYQSKEVYTDDTPFITSTGEYVHSAGVALSRDLLSRWGGSVDYGDFVFIENYGLRVVNDCMGATRCVKWENRKCVERKEIKKHVDLWVANDAEEKAVGWRSGKVWVIKYAELHGNKLIVK